MKKEFDWFDKPDNIRRLKIVSYLILTASVLAELFVPRHASHIWDKIPGFYAFFGFITCAVLIIGSKFLGKYWLKKDENYYDE